MRQFTYIISKDRQAIGYAGLFRSPFSQFVGWGKLGNGQ